MRLHQLCLQLRKLPGIRRDTQQNQSGKQCQTTPAGDQ